MHVAPRDQIHEVVFAVQLQRIDELTRILLDVSDPQSDNYGKYMTKQEVVDLTSNPIANSKIREHLTSSGATFIMESDGGDYITASGPISLWEEMFDTRFYAYHQKRETGGVLEILRAEEYSVPLHLHEYVSAVFNTVQMPMVVRAGPTPVPLKVSPTDKASNSNSNSKRSSAVSKRFPGSITPTVLKSFYNIDSTIGSRNSTQAVFETVTQYYSPQDLLKFQSTFNLNLGPVLNVGGHNNDSQCIMNSENCLEGNLDIQYIMGVAEASPTTFYWINPSKSFVDFLVQVSAMKSPPLVFSIRLVYNIVGVHDEVQLHVRWVRISLMRFTVS